MLASVIVPPSYRYSAPVVVPPKAELGAPTTKSGVASPTRLPTSASEVPNAPGTGEDGGIRIHSSVTPLPVAKDCPETTYSAPLPPPSPGAPTAMSSTPSPSRSAIVIAAVPKRSPGNWPLIDPKTCCECANDASDAMHDTLNASDVFMVLFRVCWASPDSSDLT